MLPDPCAGLQRIATRIERGASQIDATRKKFSPPWHQPLQLIRPGRWMDAGYQEPLRLTLCQQIYRLSNAGLATGQRDNAFRNLRHTNIPLDRIGEQQEPAGEQDACQARREQEKSERANNSSHDPDRPFTRVRTPVSDSQYAKRLLKGGEQATILIIDDQGQGMRWAENALLPMVNRGTSKYGKRRNAR